MIIQPGTSQAFHNLAPVQISVGAGAAGFIDTDCSTWLAPGGSLVMVMMASNGGGVIGARNTGGPDTSLTVITAVRTCYPVMLSAGKHADLYRDAANTNYYYAFGYWL
jgi:hypothetical protein